MSQTQVQMPDTDKQTVSIDQQQSEIGNKQKSAPEVTEALKTRVEKYDIEGAISELSQIINMTTDMFYRLKDIKFNYISHVCEMYTRIDFPSIMIDTCQKETRQAVPGARAIRRGEY